MTTTRILVVDDHPVARRGIRILLAGQDQLDVIGEGVDGEEAIKKSQELQPDLILLDISLPGISGIEAAVGIRKVSEGSRIIFLSQHDSPSVAKAALSTGGHGYIVKSDAGKDLLTGIREVLAGRPFISHTLVGRGFDVREAAN